MQSVLGIFVILAVASAAGRSGGGLVDRALWQRTVTALVLMFIIATVLLKVPTAREFFLGLNDVVLALQAATKKGTSLVFGYIGGAPPPFKEPFPGAAFILATQALPLILVVSALSALLYYWRILPILVRGFAWVLNRALGLDGPAGIGTAANIFVGMVEAPLLIKPYLNRMSRPDLFVIMVAGMATIAGTMMVIYAAILGQAVPESLGHILTASLINAPAAVLIARLMVRPEPDAAILGAHISLPQTATGPVDAITQGTIEGVKLLINVIAMLIVMVALVSLVNAVLSLLPDIGGAPFTLERTLGWTLSPLAWLIGIPWDQAVTAGGLLGTKIMLNEFIAYAKMADLSASTLEPRSKLILTYALCGFANFGSLGIMIGGMGTMAPNRRSEIVSLGLKSIIAGVLATALTASVVALLV